MNTLEGKAFRQEFHSKEDHTVHLEVVTDTQFLLYWDADHVPPMYLPHDLRFALVHNRYLEVFPTDLHREAYFRLQHTSSPAADPDVIALAQRLDAALLTVDLDFSNILDYPPGDYAGIIVMRYKLADEALMDASLKTALVDLYRDGLRGMLVIASPGRYRVRGEVSE
jgi:hypothetical protein